MTADIFIFLIVLVFWFLLTIFLYSKYKKSQNDLTKTEEKLEESKKVLEIRVQAKTHQLREQAEALRKENEQKTKDLRERLTELEKLQRLATGRELKMIELKEKIKKMEFQLKEGNFKRKN